MKRSIDSTVSLGSSLIAEERLRQITQEGFTAQHDDDHAGPALALAAISYAAASLDNIDIREVDHGTGEFIIRDPWPWSGTWDKREKHARRRSRTEAGRRTGRLRCLVIAGALIAAEIDRLMRERRRTS